MGRQMAVHLESIGGFDALVEAKRGDAEDFAKRRFGFRRHGVLQAAFELLQDRILAMPPHADDEGHAELLAIGVVEAMELRKFRLRQAVEAGARLFRLGIDGHGACARRLAREIRMALDQRQLLLRWRGAHGLCFNAACATHGACSYTSPSAAMKPASSAAFRLASAIFVMSCYPIIGAAAASERCSRCQCRAMSSLVASHTRSRATT